MITEQFNRRALTAAIAMSAVALIAACGGSGDAIDTSTSLLSIDSVPVDSTAITAETAADANLPTYAIVTGDTLSGIAARAGVSLDDLVAANGWSDGADHSIFPGDAVRLPAGAVMSAAPANTSAPATSEAASAGASATTAPSAGAPSKGGYGPATVDLFPTGGGTDPVVSPLPDGHYWASTTSSDGTNVTFTLGQYFTCDGSQFEEYPELECPSGFDTISTPSATVRLASNAVVTIATGSSLENQTLADVSPGEYTRLVSGQQPAADAPAGFVFLDWITFVEVKGGSAVAVMQMYTS